MQRIVLEFQGVRGVGLPAAVLAAVAAGLLVFAIVQLVRRRWWDAALAGAGALGPAIAPVLLVGAGRGYLAGRRRRANAALAGGIATLLATAAALAFVATSGDRTRAFWMAALAIEVAVAVGVFYASVYASLGMSRAATLMVLRCAAIAALMVLLFKPAVALLPESRDERAYLPILVDRSGSMSTSDAAGATDRYAAAVAMLNSQRGAIERDFRPVWMHFAERTRLARSLDELAGFTPSGEGAGATDIASALRAATANYSADELAGVVLLSDGLHNADTRLDDAERELGAAVYALGVGSDQANPPGRANVRVASVSAPMQVVGDNVATISARLDLTGVANSSTEVRLLAAGSDQTLATASVWSDSPSHQADVELKWTPRGTDPGDSDAAGASPDVRRLRVVAASRPHESVTADNAADLHVLVTEPRIGVLYVEGAIRPEFDTLARLLRTDANVQFMGLVRIAGNRFYTPDQIAGRQLNTLPATDEEFDLFDVIILGDLDRTFYSSAQLAGLRRFVNDGGGLIMIGGHNSFGPGGFADTAVADVLPVICGPRSQAQETTLFVPQLTAAGDNHAIFDGIGKYFPAPGREATADQELPELLGCVRVVGAKPAASVLAVHPSRRNPSGPLVVLAVQNYGAGRSAAFTADTTRLWDLPMRGVGAESPYHQFWGQTIRWLANVETRRRETAPAVVLRIDRAYVEQNAEVRATSYVQDATGPAGEATEVTLTAAPLDAPARPIQVPMAPTRSRGTFEAAFRPEEPGRYRVTVSAAAETGEQLGRDELELTVAERSPEMERLARDDSTLAEIADVTGGRAGDLWSLPETLAEIVRRQQARSLPKPAGEIVPLYNFPVLFVAFVVFMTAEWLLRRSWQLQ